MGIHLVSDQNFMVHGCSWDFVFLVSVASTMKSSNLAILDIFEKNKICGEKKNGCPAKKKCKKVINFWERKQVPLHGNEELKTHSANG